MTHRLLRPLAQMGPPRSDDALPLAGGRVWFDRVAIRAPGAAWQVHDLDMLTADEVSRLSAPRPALPGASGGRPAIMGILNTTPDSFSDGGLFADPAAALDHARAMVAQGADILDVGGESTRPGAAPVPADEEIGRVVPVLDALAQARLAPVSIDTRKAAVARAALAAGAAMVNDVSALGFDPDMAPTVAAADVPVCLMHAKGAPASMQDAPRYDDVVAEVYAALADRIALAEAAGIARARIVIDPGIGFGKTVTHNLTLMRDIAVFHGLGCPILLGASRKRVIGAVGGGEAPADRVAGSVAAALWAVAQGVQIVRVHDVAETRQALDVHRAVSEGAA